ncbi:EamA-like transporter family protein [Andreprevotia lacus DSM 23236]|jgi:drug/metabolite transporter (DMT)-like permease|uniref:EamA-like transporter family protein n=1 Tax=Andreprevotia lacus DSM 23236 TaxID=1121001 RepID=A0A1W1X177_9NEIS|nr:EamA family transporter [Andreprevotia lacus]SMC17657.1 EamA-like transporter family protein [Andreprevotia lacus DSM 23236]
MSLTDLLLVIAAAVIHACWNLLAKRAQGGGRLIWGYSLFSTIVYLPMAAWLIQRDGLHWSALQWALVLASTFFNIGYAICLQRGYRLADMSVVYPLARGSGPLLSVSGAILLLGERPSWLAAVGALLVVGGVFMLAGGPAMFRWPDARLRAGLGYGLATGAFIACYTLSDGYAVQHLQIAPLLLCYFGSALRLLIMAPHALGDREDLLATFRSKWPHMLGIGALAPLSYILVLTAMQTAPISYVAPAREMSMLLGAFFGARLLGEGDVARRLAGAALIAAGVAGLALG